MKPRQPPRTSGPRGGANSSRSIRRAWKMWGDVRSDLCPTKAEVFFVRKEDRMSVESLKCKECGASYELDARFVCEQLLRPARGRLRPLGAGPGRGASGKIQAGSQGIWRYADFLPFEGRPGDPLEPGLTPLLRADRLAERLGLEPSSGSRTTPPTRPTPSRTGSSRSPSPRRRSSASRPSPAPRPATSPTPSPPTPPPPGSTPTSSSRPTSRSRSCSRPAIYGTNLVGVRGNYDDVNRLCTQLAETRPWAFVNVNLRPYYAEGSKTLAFETVEQLGWKLPGPGRLPDRLGLAVHQGRQGHPASGSTSAWSRASCRPSTAPRRRAAARWRRPSPRAGRSASPQRSPETIAKSLAIGDPADGPYALELARETGGAIESVTDEEIRDGIRLLAETTGIFTETAGGVTIGVLAKLAEAGEIGSERARRRLHHRRGPEDARRGARSLRDARDRPHPRRLRGGVRGVGRPPRAASASDD